MMNLLIFREQIRKLLQRYHRAAKPIGKFLAAFLLFSSLKSMFGYSDFFSSTFIIAGISLVCAWVSLGVLFFLTGIITTMHLLSLSPEIGVMYAVVFLIAYLLYIRLDMKACIPMLFGPILFVVNLPYLFPIIVGMFFGPVGIIPAAFGTFIYFFSMYAKEAVTVLNTTTSEDTVQLYSYIVEKITNDENFLLTVIVFSIVIVITYLIYRRSMDYSWQIAIFAGGIGNIILFLAGSFILETESKIFSVILGSLLAILLGEIVQFFRCVVDYSRIENVQFEDDEYYYYVKAVPKMAVAEQDFNVKRINSRRRTKKM